MFHDAAAVAAAQSIHIDENIATRELPKFVFQDTVKWGNRGRRIKEKRTCMKQLIEGVNKVPNPVVEPNSGSDDSDSDDNNSDDTSEDDYSYVALKRVETKLKK